MYQNLTTFFSRIAVSFFVAVCVITLSGACFGDEMMELSSFYVKEGISFTAIFQLLAMISLLSLVNIILDQPWILPHMRITYKIILRFAIAIGLTISCAYAWAWFPIGDHKAWISFLISFGVCFATACALSIYATRKKDQKYQQLLETYKAKRR